MASTRSKKELPSAYPITKKPRLKPGDAIFLAQSDQRKDGKIFLTGRREYGRIIDHYWDDFHQLWRCWIAFFGFKWPNSRQLKKEKPYVLTYSEMFLHKFDPPKSAIDMKRRPSKKSNKKVRGAT